MKKIVWTIAGSDSGGGAGIQADLHTFNALNVHGCSVVTTVTAQNSIAVDACYDLPTEAVLTQIESLNRDLTPHAIKLGLLGKESNLLALGNFLQSQHCPIIFDPVVSASSGASFTVHIEKWKSHIFPYVTLLTPNLLEAELLSGIQINNYNDMESAARIILALGVKSVVIKGGHFSQEKYSCDYWSDGKESFWINSPRIFHSHTHGSGCTLSSAIAASMAQAYSLKDAFVLAKLYVTQGIREGRALGQGPGPLMHRMLDYNAKDLPSISDSPLISAINPMPPLWFKNMGIYPIVDNAAELSNLLPLGIRIIQLRIKNQPHPYISAQIENSVNIAKKFKTQLFINDYWQLAIQHQAFGVHVGQEDLKTMDREALQKAGLRLGISTHSFFEMSRAHAFSPTYIAFGPIFPTTSKIMPFLPQGLDNLKKWRSLSAYPLVAIGGIGFEALSDIFNLGVEGVAMISAIKKMLKPALPPF